MAVDKLARRRLARQQQRRGKTLALRERTPHHRFHNRHSRMMAHRVRVIAARAGAFLAPFAGHFHHVAHHVVR